MKAKIKCDAQVHQLGENKYEKRWIYELSRRKKSIKCWCSDWYLLRRGRIKWQKNTGKG